MKQVNRLIPIGLLAMSLAYLMKHTVGGESYVGEFLMGASTAVILLGFIFSKYSDRIKAFKQRLIGAK